MAKPARRKSVSQQRFTTQAQLERFVVKQMGLIQESQTTTNDRIEVLQEGLQTWMAGRQSTSQSAKPIKGKVKHAGA